MRTSIITEVGINCDGSAANREIGASSNDNGSVASDRTLWNKPRSSFSDLVLALPQKIPLNNRSTYQFYRMMNIRLTNPIFSEVFHCGVPTTNPGIIDLDWVADSEVRQEIIANGIAMRGILRLIDMSQKENTDRHDSLMSVIRVTHEYGGCGVRTTGDDI